MQYCKTYWINAYHNTIDHWPPVTCSPSQQRLRCWRGPIQRVHAQTGDAAGAQAGWQARAPLAIAQRQALGSSAVERGGVCVPGEGLGEEGAIVSHLLEKKGNMAFLLKMTCLKLKQRRRVVCPKLHPTISILQWGTLIVRCSNLVLLSQIANCRFGLTASGSDNSFLNALRTPKYLAQKFATWIVSICLCVFLTLLDGLRGSSARLSSR